MSFNFQLTLQPTNPLRPINPGNAWGFCITAPAGTELGSPYSFGTVTLAGSSRRKELYTPKSFFIHVTSLRQAFAHCGRFSTAASRRSMARVAVPFLGVALSRPLPVIALVSHYLTNKLIGRRPFSKRKSLRTTFTLAGLWKITPSFNELCSTLRYVSTCY